MPIQNRVGVDRFEACESMDSFIKAGDMKVKREWTSMIRFGSQEDVFLRMDREFQDRHGQQLYTGTAVIPILPELLTEVNIVC